VRISARRFHLFFFCLLFLLLNGEFLLGQSAFSGAALVGDVYEKSVL
jgi:hypothetical protein